METDFMIVRHSRKDEPAKVTIEKRGYDLTNYSFLRMNPASTMAEWVWSEDLEIYRKIFGFEE